VILAASTTNLTAIRQVTSTVPVVFVSVSDPVAQGFVASVRQPGGNITGFSRYEFSIGGKWLGLLKEAAPGLVRVAVMFNPDTSPQLKFFMYAIEAAAESLGVQALAAPVRATADIEPALESFGRQPNGGLILTSDTFTNLRYPLIANLAGQFEDAVYLRRSIRVGAWRAADRLGAALEPVDQKLVGPRIIGQAFLRKNAHRR
jgi:putative ABC transport system substrate-binding protein